MRNVADDAPRTPATAGALPRKLPRELCWALPELLALTGLAIAQPVLDVTGKAPDFFLYHRAGRDQILAMIALVEHHLGWAADQAAHRADLRVEPVGAQGRKRGGDRWVKPLGSQRVQRELAGDLHG